MDLTIFVDADACPVKDEIYRVAGRHAVPVKVVANNWFRVPVGPLVEQIVVADSFDAADDWIAERAGPASIVVTGDILLADRCVKLGATVLGHTGKPFTPASIGNAVASRALAEHRRAMGEDRGGPAPFVAADRSRFLSALDAALVRLKRG